MAGAVLAAVVLTVLLPDDLRLGPVWLLPAVEATLLGTIILGDPGRIDRRSRTLRVMSIALVGVLAAGALTATGELIHQLIVGGSVTRSAKALLGAGATVWSANAIAFGLLYWEVDGGGSAARAHRLREHPDFAFPQQLNPELAPSGWRPSFVDYLYLSFTNCTALSPTDTMPLAPWAKLAMTLQSLISLSILGLVVANAANLFK
ncbi:MAG TPA: hypothetical protein VFG42_14610 [Baekduia sp.]|uniref:hypothetical protein n=1 Tax=Baekduia sp. TaxID=2600305 RepID=UPI002D7725ED|nr:hypothetical protein [Baekduia sp.]HET6508019.1 hypothetical protein [Baekduia sp.]